MTERTALRAAYWYHLGISILTIGLTMAIALFIYEQVGEGIFPWWVYGAYLAYIVSILAIDHILFAMEPVKDKKPRALQGHPARH